MNRLILIVLFAVCCLFCTTSKASAQTKLGVHLLQPEEIHQAHDLLPGGGYLTVVLPANQLDETKWQSFFDSAQEYNFTPIIRLATEFQEQSWRLPTKKDITRFAHFLNQLNWYQDQLNIIVFNEPNHAAEWGGQVDPISYAQTLAFTADWFHTEPKQYLILNAALDAAAPNGPITASASSFLSELHQADPTVLKKIDTWNSHSYPNPHFSASPYQTNPQSIRGYQHELAQLKLLTDKDLDCFITETGWSSNKLSFQTIALYYQHALDQVWLPDEKIKAITPFLLNAQAGPFQVFSLLDKTGQPTPAYKIIQTLSSQLNHELAMSFEN